MNILDNSSFKNSIFNISWLINFIGKNFIDQLWLAKLKCLHDCSRWICSFLEAAIQFERTFEKWTYCVRTLAQLVSKTRIINDTCTQTFRRQNLAYYVGNLMRQHTKLNRWRCRENAAKCQKNELQELFNLFIMLRLIKRNFHKCTIAQDAICHI